MSYRTNKPSASEGRHFFFLSILFFCIMLSPYILVSKIYPKSPLNLFENKWIALVIEYSSGDYFKRYIEGAKEQAHKLGLRLEVLDAKNNRSLMPGMIDDVMLRNVDGIMISHGSASLLTPSIKRSIKRNIPIVAIHNDIDLPGVSIVGQDEQRMAQMMMDKFVSDFGGQADFILVWVTGYIPMFKRINVYNKIMKKNPGLKELKRFGVAGEATDIHTEISMKEILQSYPRDSIDAVIATWDEYAKGAARAIIQEGRNEIRVYGLDINDEVLEMLQDEKNPWIATVGVDSKSLGKVQVRMLAHALQGHELPEHYSLTPVLITKDMLPHDTKVTMSNIGDYITDWDKIANYPFKIDSTDE